MRHPKLLAIIFHMLKHRASFGASVLNDPSVLNTFWGSLCRVGFSKHPPVSYHHWPGRGARVLCVFWMSTTLWVGGWMMVGWKLKLYFLLPGSRVLATIYTLKIQDECFFFLDMEVILTKKMAWEYLSTITKLDKHAAWFEASRNLKVPRQEDFRWLPRGMHFFEGDSEFCTSSKLPPPKIEPRFYWGTPRTRVFPHSIGGNYFLDPSQWVERGSTKTSSSTVVHNVKMQGCA